MIEEPIVNPWLGRVVISNNGHMLPAAHRDWHAEFLGKLELLLKGV